MWSTPKDLRAQLVRLWERGELLRDVVTGNIRFPLRLTTKGPTSKDITERFDIVRTWVSELANTSPLRLEWQEIRHQVQGLQRLPSGVWIDSMDDALGWINKRREWGRFSDLVEMTRGQCPLLLSWLEKRPLQALELEADWPRLLAVVDWVKRHPQPAIYLRQVDLPGIHSKFIELHRSVLSELLDLTLPASSVDTSKTGTAQFAARYGFLEKPTRIRFRILDPEMQVIPGTLCPDITLDADNFSRLAIDVHQVLITENETNFLALPNIPKSIAIFGAGYGWGALSQARWLTQCAIYYWGDIDTHGFAILNQLREHFPHVVSLFMDMDTLIAHTELWGLEGKPQYIDLTNLTKNEQHLYNALRDNHIREGLRLEQEHLDFGWVINKLQLLQKENTNRELLRVTIYKNK